MSQDPFDALTAYYEKFEQEVPPAGLGARVTASPVGNLLTVLFPFSIGSAAALLVVYVAAHYSGPAKPDISYLIREEAMSAGYTLPARHSEEQSLNGHLPEVT